MQKKIKLDLNDLKVQSFITAITPFEKKMLKGGSLTNCDKPTYQPGCSYVTCIPVCTNTGGGCTGLPECCN